MNRSLLPLALVTSILTYWSASAAAQSSPWSLRVGPAAAFFDESSSVKVAGAKFPGAEIELENNSTLGIEIGYALTSDFTLRLAVGVPPTTTLKADGTLQGMVPPLSGKLGRAKYGPAVLSLTYGLPNLGAVRPYVGVGVNYTKIFSTSDGDVSGLRIDSGWGSALQAGFEWPLDERWSLFADVRKIFFKTKATGTVPALGNPPAEADITVNPTLVHVGIGYRF